VTHLHAGALSAGSRNASVVRTSDKFSLLTDKLWAMVWRLTETSSTASKLLRGGSGHRADFYFGDGKLRLPAFAVLLRLLERSERLSQIRADVLIRFHGTAGGHRMPSFFKTGLQQTGQSRRSGYAGANL
jgi:hypothetical protein